MEKIKKYRYPGINSFETTDADIFYGREDDRKKLADLVEIEKTVLVYSRSGLGKSSLLKAALMPELTLRGYRPYYIRLGLFQENSLSPVQNIIRRTVLQELKQLPNTFLQKFINRTNSLWYVFKSLQVAHPENDRPIALIFDQFEEIS
ncbi:MAG: ATP-binding protein, partial [Microcoleus sp. C1-bin4]|nr:ATP-binding protein [Microcoleus sp. C1-bin4]